MCTSIPFQNDDADEYTHNKNKSNASNSDASNQSIACRRWCTCASEHSTPNIVRRNYLHKTSITDYNRVHQMYSLINICTIFRIVGYKGA